MGFVGLGRNWGWKDSAEIGRGKVHEGARFDNGLKSQNFTRLL